MMRCFCFEMKSRHPTMFDHLRLTHTSLWFFLTMKRPKWPSLPLGMLLSHCIHQQSSEPPPDSIILDGRVYRYVNAGRPADGTRARMANLTLRSLGPATSGLACEVNEVRIKIQTRRS